MSQTHKSHFHGSQEVWDEVFENIDLTYSESTQTQGKLFEHVKIQFLEQIFPAAPASILEVGSGTGFVSLYFAKRGYQPTCLDTDRNILKIAAENFAKEKTKGEFVVGDAEKLPFSAEKFDIVTSFGLLEHFSDPAVAIAEMARVLKTGGLFFADIVPERFSCQSVGDIFNSFSSLVYWSSKGKVFSKMKSKAERNFKPLYFENRLSVAEYKEIIEKSGISDLEIRGNRPFPRLTLPNTLDKAYASVLKPSLKLWEAFDRWDSDLARFWGAGWWFWGYKTK